MIGSGLVSAKTNRLGVTIVRKENGLSQEEREIN